jgi:aryl-alcohol dehydrogenase-like predicted oxidoreductase
VYSKLDPALDLSDKFAVRGSVENSLSKLKIDRLEGLLLHHEDGLNYWNKGLGSILKELVAENKVRSIGASFYTPQKAFEALDIDGIDLVQVPANILDRRFEEIGVFSKALGLGKDVFVRSIFIQGLLLALPDRIPLSMRYALPYLKRFAQTASDMKLSHRELAFGYACCAWPKAYIIFGAETAQQVRENTELAGRRINVKTCKKIGRELAGAEESLLNPAMWPK